MRFHAYDELAGVPHIIADGPPREDTLLCLSHWPKSGTPRSLKADLSAEIVFRYLETPAARVPARAASNNHFDEDGLISIFALTAPDDAMPHRALLEDAAAAGDFGTFKTREGARLAIALGSIGDSRRSILDAGVFRLSGAAQTAGLYQQALRLLPEILGRPDRFRALWQEGVSRLEESEKQMRGGRVVLEEVPEVDLCIVTMPEGLDLHPMALRNAAKGYRLLVIQGRRYELRYRYESWVQCVVRGPQPRVDLGPLARRLTELERGGARWVFEGVDDITPALRLEGGGNSRLSPRELRALVLDILRAAPPAWDPYDAEPARLA